MKPAKKHTAKCAKKPTLKFELGVVYGAVATVLAEITGVRWGSVTIQGVHGVHHLACYELPITIAIARKVPLEDLENDLLCIVIDGKTPSETIADWCDYLREDLRDRIITVLEELGNTQQNTPSSATMTGHILSAVKASQPPASVRWSSQYARMITHWSAKNIDSGGEIRAWLAANDDQRSVLSDLSVDQRSVLSDPLGGAIDPSSADRSHDNTFWDTAEVIPAHVFI